MSAKDIAHDDERTKGTGGIIWDGMVWGGFDGAGRGTSAIAV